MSDLAQWPSRWAGKRVVVLGDLCLDEYIVGKAQRLSREAPVPVLEFQERFVIPGAACSPALNLLAVGGSPQVVGIVGDDEAGRALLQTLRAAGLDTSGILVEADRTTTVKTRVLASHLFPHQVARIDRLDRQPLSRSTTAKLQSAVTRAIAQADAVLISDYRNGVLEASVVRHVLGLAQKHGLLIAVDSQGEFAKYKGVSLLRCNKEEAETYLRRRLRSEKAFSDAAVALKKRLNAQSIVITRGSEGMSLVDAAGDSYHLPASNPSEVYDVTGAGDAVIALLTIALAGGAGLLAAAQIANVAAGLVVRKLGNATVSLPQLTEALHAYNDVGTGPPVPTR